MFDFQEETLEKHDEELTDIYHTRMNFPIPTTNQRFPFKAHFFERINDIDLNLAHIIPNLNIHGIDRDKVGYGCFANALYCTTAVLIAM